VRTAAVVPVHDGRGWLPACLAALEGQGFERVVVVDDGSRDGTAPWLAEAHPGVEVVHTGPGGPRGFAVAAQAGVVAAGAWAEAIALVNADVELRPGWLEAALAGLASGPAVGAVAGKMVRREDPGVIDDAGDLLRRDGVCEQRGRLRRDDGRWDVPGEVWGACAGAALYRRSALREAGGFHAGYRNYLEDVDLALALRSAGWTCAYAPGAVAVHAGGGSAAGLPAPVRYWVARNTLLLVARWFPVRWWPAVLYRQASWLVAAARDGVLGPHLRGLRDGLAAGARAWPGRRARRRTARVPVAQAVPPRPWRGPAAGGHPRGVE
jgi:GT2 family glycosyltransferase